jgi:hypothetical protein
MPNIDLSILNQKATPAFFADTLANRPAPSFVGRIFISTDTLDLYRDTGTAWLLLSPSSTGTITGSGAAGQVTYFSATSSITGSNNLFWDSVNGHFGIGTNAPGTALQINHGQSQLIRLNQTTATNDTKIAFQNSGVALWRIGNSYNAGANDYAVFDVVSNLERFSIKTTGQTFIGAQTTSSGRLVVNDATGDNHIVVIGATAPSLRINNSGSGATKQIGIGLATATNNFIQGAVDRDMAIFNGSTTPSPILFGVYDAGTSNTQEAARISAARNFILGSIVDTGEKIQITGNGSITGTLTTGSPLSIKAATPFIRWQNVAGTRLGYIQHNATNLVYSADVGVHQFIQEVNNIVSYSAGGTAVIQSWQRIGGAVAANMLYDDATLSMNFGTTTAHPLNIRSNNVNAIRVASNQNVIVGSVTDNGNKFQVFGGGIYITTPTTAGTEIGLTIQNVSSTSSGVQQKFKNGFGDLAGIKASQMDNGAGADNGQLELQTAIDSVLATQITISDNGNIKFHNLPTSSAGLGTGQIWNNGGVLNIV